MSSDNQDRPAVPESGAPEPVPSAPSSMSTSRWDRTKFLFRAIEVRLRFIALFVGIGLLMVYWRTLENYWDRWTRPVTTVAAESDTEYYCPMHPSVVRPGLEPNGAVPNCPICGMPLSKRKKGELPVLPEGVIARVQLSPERIRLAGVATSAASYRPLNVEIRTVGYVAYDERRLSEIVTRFGGYIEKLYVDNTFIDVTKDEPLAEIYSPELYSSVQELRLAQKHASAELVASSRKRLKLFGVSDAEIDEILADDTDRPTLLIRSPQSGQVIEKNVVEGSSVASGATLFKVADLSEVWIEADVFERDLPYLHKGQSVEASVEAYPGQAFPGVIELIYPELNPETRTSRIRIAFKNYERKLRPGMYATVLVKSPVSEAPTEGEQPASDRQPVDGSDDALIAYQKTCPVTGAKLGSIGPPVKTTVGDRTIFLCCAGCERPLRRDPERFLANMAPPPGGGVLSVPESAIIDTGRSKIVYVEREPGLFEGVEVELGRRAGGFYPVLAGLSPGDRVATAGSFLIDAETRLNPAAASAYFGASGGPSTGTANGSSTARGSSDRTASPSQKDLENIAKLPPEDQELVKQQGICPVTDEPLGSMGVPVKVMVRGRPVFVCCQGCIEPIQADPEKFLKKLKPPRAAEPAASERPASPVHRH